MSPAARMIGKALQALTVFFMLCAFAPGLAVASQKVALVIGNADYRHAQKLANPLNDANAIRETLEKAEFEVMLRTDLTRKGMTEALEDFRKRSAEAEIAIVFYSGHGVEFEGKNYFIPVDAELETDTAIKYEAITFDDVLGSVASARKLKLILIDACRDNPFTDKMKRILTRGAATRGLARVNDVSVDGDILVGYATAPGEVALDGTGNNSPYTRALTKYLTQPGVEIEASLRQVANAVYKETNGKQRPYKTGSLLNTIILSPAKPDKTDLLAEKAAFNLARNQNTEEGWEEFLASFPDGLLFDIAKGERNKLTQSAALSVEAAPDIVEDPVVDTLNSLALAAVREGALNVIALPHDWCNYRELIESFKRKYPGIVVTELNPDAGSADEVDAVRAGKTANSPDVVDVGLAFGTLMKAEGLLQPYKVSTFDEIPSAIKDQDGSWYGGYYGVVSFLVNKDLVANTPRDWTDLLKPEYAGQVALAGDPRTSYQAMLAVVAAGLAQDAKYGNKAGEAGLAYFAEMNKAGNFLPVAGKAGTMAQGATPIIVGWDYNTLGWARSLNGNPPTEVVIPQNGVLAGAYVQAISAYAPHPSAAKLWMEHLYSDEGQLAWLRGFCHPVRFNAMVKAGKIPQDLIDVLPPATAYEKVYFPTLEEADANKIAITGGWASVVGANAQ